MFDSSGVHHCGIIRAEVMQMDWFMDRLEGLKSAVISAVIVAASAWGMTEYANLEGNMKLLVDALAILVVALWNQFRSQQAA